jgi:hypothetical protein
MEDRMQANELLAFTVFCLTVIAIVALVLGRGDVAVKALAVIYEGIRAVIQALVSGLGEAVAVPRKRPMKGRRRPKRLNKSACDPGERPKLSNRSK